MKGSVDRGHTEKNVPGEERADGHCCPGISSKPRPSDSSLWPLGSFLAHIGTEQRQQSTCLGKTLLIVETMEAETGSSPWWKARAVQEENVPRSHCVSLLTLREFSLRKHG